MQSLFKSLIQIKTLFACGLILPTVLTISSEALADQSCLENLDGIQFTSPLPIDLCSDDSDNRLDFDSTPPNQDLLDCNSLLIENRLDEALLVCWNALEVYQKRVEAAQDITNIPEKERQIRQNRLWQADVLYNIAQIELRLGNIENAETLIIRSIKDIYRDINGEIVAYRVPTSPSVIAEVTIFSEALGEATTACRDVLLEVECKSLRAEARALVLLGDRHFDTGNYDMALAVYEIANQLYRLAIGSSTGRASGSFEDIPWLRDLARSHTLVGAASTALVFQEFKGELPIDQDLIEYARGNYNLGLGLAMAAGDPILEAETRTRFGYFYHTMSLIFENQKDELGKSALTYYEASRDIQRELGDRYGLISTLGYISGLQRHLDQTEAALATISEAIETIEEQRSSLSHSDSRTSFFDSFHDFYRWKIDLLMELGRTEEAFNVSEQARSRTLIELLASANLQLPDADLPDFLQIQEQQLEREFLDLEKRRIDLWNSTEEYPDDEFRVANQEISQEYNQLLRQQQELARNIQAVNPVYAALNYSSVEPLQLKQIQQEVLDEETVLLQYAIGSNESFLWVVNNAGEIFTHTIPLGQNELEARINEFLTTIGSSGTKPGTELNDNSYFKRRSRELVQLLIPPEIDDQIEIKERLLIVADGILHKLPFSALPIAEFDAYTPLIKEYEIVNAPSTTAIHISRQQFIGRESAPKTLAMIADPVFSREDPRLPFVEGEREACRRLDASQSNEMLSASLEFAPVPLQIAARNTNRSERIRPLPCTSEEAEAIIRLIDSPAQTTLVSGLEATYDWVTSSASQLDQYQIVQFATHGIFDDVTPEFSGLILSLVDEEGNPQPGYLDLREIFNLKLNAELVVLSACETGLGQEFQGEGLVGLTRGFMYAGTKRVMATLWNVSDPATAELMSLFYQGLLEENLSPTAALQQAQITMWENYKDPYLWAAFTIQGDWQD